MKKIFSFLAAALMSAGMFAQQLATPVISGATEFTDETEVTITCETEGVDIYYTTDLGSPSSFYEGSILYTGPFKLTKTAYVKAIAFQGDYMSDEARAQFVKQTEMGLQYVELPIPSTWEGDETIISATDLQWFQQVTKEQAVQWPELEDNSILIYGFEENGNAMYVMYNYGSKGAGRGLQSYKNIQRFFEHLYSTTGYEGEPEPVAPMFEMSYEDKWLKVNPTDGEGQYFVFVEDKVYYDNRYRQYDQTTMQGYMDYVVGVVVGMSAQSNFVFSGEKDIDPDPIYHTWYDNDHMLINHDYVAFVFKIADDARTSDVEYLILTYEGEPEAGAVEHVALNVKQAKKVVVDGQLYIVREGKLFNVAGAQVR